MQGNRRSLRARGGVSVEGALGVSLQFLARAQDQAGLDGWQQLAQILLLTSELMFVD